MDQLHLKRFCIDPWLVEPELNQITHGEQCVKLEPLTMRVLVYLVRHANTVVSRDELLTAVWNDRFVTENTLSRTISRLRKALEDDWQRPRYLETISKTGYRWISPVRMLQPGEPLPLLARTSTVGSGVKPGPRAGWPLPVGLGVGLLAALLLLARYQQSNASVTLSRVRPVVTLAGRQANPVISPDGQHVAFAWQGLEGENWDIYVQSVGADNPSRLTTDPSVEVLPAWSPDGRYLAFMAAAPTPGIFRVPLLGGPKVRLADCIDNPRHLAWSPDGLSLAFDGQASPTGLRAVYLVSVDGGTPERLIEPLTGSKGDRQPMFSPDGSKLAFLRQHTADLHHVYVYDFKQKATRQLTAHPVGRIRGLDWMPDGDGLVYSFNRDGRFALWRAGLHGNPPRRLPITDDWVTYPSLARETDALIYKNYADVIDLWSLELDPSGTVSSEAKRLVPSTRSEMHPHLSPEDGRLAFLSNRTGAFEVWSGTGDRLIRHTRLEGLVPGLVSWHPDGTQLVFDVRREGQSDLWLVDASGRAPERVTETPFNEVNPCFAPGEPGIFYSSDQTGDWQIWERDLVTGISRQRTRSGGFFAQADPEGQVLWFAKLNRPGVFRLDLATGEETEVWSGLGQIDWGNWQVCRDSIYYLDRTTQSLMRVTPDREIQLIYKAPRTFPYLGRAFHVDPDAGRVVFGQIAQSDDEIMMATLR